MTVDAALTILDDCKVRCQILDPRIVDETVGALGELTLRDLRTVQLAFLGVRYGTTKRAILDTLAGKIHDRRASLDRVAHILAM